MEKQLGKEYVNDSERIKFLKDNCDEVQEMDYMRQFTPEELLEMKDKLSEVDIKIDNYEVERKKRTQEIDAKLKVEKQDHKRLLKNLREKSELVSENCFKFIDEET